MLDKFYSRKCIGEICIFLLLLVWLLVSTQPPRMVVMPSFRQRGHEPSPLIGHLGAHLPCLPWLWGLVEEKWDSRELLIIFILCLRKDNCAVLKKSFAISLKKKSLNKVCI